MYYSQDEHSITSEDGSYTIEATPDSFKLTLNVDDSVHTVNAPHMIWLQTEAGRAN